MKKLLLYSVLILLGILFFNQANAYVTTSGNVSGQYWHTDTYYVTGNLTVDAGSTLEIQAGARVKFAPGINLTVYGTLIANGNSSSNIFFTSRDDDNVGEIISGSDGNPNPGDWGYITINGSGNNEGLATFNYCHARYGGSGGYGNIYFYYADAPTFTNSSAAYSSNYGIMSNSSNAQFEGSDFASNNSHGINATHGELQINNCFFLNNSGYAANLSNVNIVPYTDNTGSGNTINAFGISGTIDQNFTLAQSICGFPYVLIGATTLTTNHILTIPAGEVIKNWSGSLMIYGTLNAIGTSSQNIVFTSLYDDSYGGDLNGDGDATTPAKGNWQHIYMYGSGANNQGIGNMDYCKVLYAGASYGYAVYYSYSDDGYFTNSLIQYSDYAGLQADYDTLTVTNNSFLNCDTYGVYATGATLNLDNCIFNNNGSHGIFSNSGGELQINNCQFNNNAGYAANLNTINIKTYTGNTGSGNTINAFGISGTIDQNLALSQSVCGFPYVLIGTTTQTANHILTIPAGEVIKSLNGSLTINGTLNAIGTASQNIIFTSLYDDTHGGDLNGDGNATSPAKGNWQHIYMYGSGANNQGIGNMDYCKVLYAGASYGYAVYYSYSDDGYFTNSLIQYSDYAGLQADYDTLTVTNNSFLNCDTYGVYATGATLNLDNCIFNNNGSHGIFSNSGGELQINNCQFNNNGGYAANLNTINIKTYTGNTGTGNTINAFGISGTIDQNFTLSQSVCGFPYVLIGATTLTTNHTLTIPAGEVIKNWSGSLMIYGTLNAIGTSSQNIVFTSLYDDSYGGDLNGDGDATTPAKGNWQHIYMYGSGANNQGIGNMDYCKVLYAGASYGYAVYYSYSDDGYFTNSLIQYSDYAGLQADYDTLTVTNNSFLNCDTYGVYATGATLNLDNCIFNNNGSHGIFSNSGGELQINNCQFNNNAGYAANLNTINIKTYTGNTGSGNTINAFGISGTIDQNLALSQSVCGFPYVLIGTTTQTANHILTIPAGEVIKSLNGSLTINGTLNAIGTASQNIIFTSLYDDTHGGDLNGDGNATSPAKGNWQHIYMYGSGANNQGIGNMDYCKVLYAGASYGYAVYYSYSDDGYFTNSLIQYSDYAGLQADYDTLTVTNNSFLNCDTYGVYATGATLNLDNCIFNNNGSHGIFSNSGGELQINNCQFNNNGGYAANLNTINIKTYTGNTGTGNTINAFGISGTIDQNFTLSQSVCGFPYVLIGATTLTTNHTLTIPAGEVIKNWGGSLMIYGALNAIGTASQNIVFTSLYDDTYGGDLNGDGDATTPAKGNWQHIYMYGSGANNQGIGNMDYCKVLYAGATYGYAVYYSYSDAGYFTNSLIQYSDNAGLQADNTTMYVRGNNFLDNDTYGVYISGSLVPDLGEDNLANAGLNTFANNNGGNIQLYNVSTQEIDAYYNDWGFYTEAEIDAHIYDDDENASYGQVHFDPWYDPSNPPFVVHFGADTLSGEAPLAVQFVDSTLFGANYWEWDFENDGEVDSYDQNPSHMYFDGGIYSVKLEASNGLTTDSFTRTDYINITPNQHLRSYALNFDGVDDFVEVLNFTYPEDLTIEAWIKPMNFDTYQEIIYFIGDHSVQFRMNLDGSIVFGEYAWGNWNYVLSDGGMVYLNQWNHLAVSKAGDQVNLYINGVHAGYSQFDNNPVISTLYFGTRSDAMDRYFAGAMDEVRIWSKALSQSEIRANMTNYLNGTETDLLAYYRLNDVAGQTGYDFTGHGYNATLGSSEATDNNDPVWIQTNWPYDTYFLADFTANPTFGNPPLEVQFTDFSMGIPNDWQWDFDNDGNIDSYDQNPLWTFGWPGNYTVKLIISDGIVTDTIVKYNFIDVRNPDPITIEAARQEVVGTLLTIEGIVTSGPEYGNLHFIQDATAGMALYSADLNYFRMGDFARVSGFLTDYNGLLELINITGHEVFSNVNPLPPAQVVAIGDMGEQYESEIVRIDMVNYADGGNAFAAGTNYFFNDFSGSTYLRLHVNSNLVNQRIPDIPTSFMGICVHSTINPAAPYCIYGRDYNDLVYTEIEDFSRQATGFSKRFSFVNSMAAVDENTVWATAFDPKGISLVNEVTKTTDGGTNWQAIPVLNTDGLNKSGIFALDGNTAWLMTYYQYGINPQGIYATIDGGATWTHQSTAIFDKDQGGFPNVIYFWDAYNGICMGDPTGGYFEIYTTNDGGTNWSRVDQSNIPAPLTGEYGYSNNYKVVSNTIWFSTNMGRLYKSIDQGLTWSAIQTPSPSYVEFAFKDQDNGLVLQKNNLNLYETDDGGSSWQQVFYSGNLRPNALCFVPGSNPGTYVSTSANGYNAGASYSLDNGTTWQNFPETQGVHFGATDWVSPTTGFFGANNVDATEGGMWKYNGFGVGYSIAWDPTNPTENDMITITITNPAATPWLHWGVNDANFMWQTPDNVYWPVGSVFVDPAIQSPFNGPDANNTYTLQIGPFNDPAQIVDRLAFVIYFENNTWDNNNGVDYHINIEHLVPYQVTWEPEFPTENDAITITAGPVSVGGNLHWGIENNSLGWQTPDMAYWPVGSFLFEGTGPAIQSPFTGPDENGMITITLLPFNNSAQTVDAVNFVLNFYDNTWDNNNGNNYYIPISHPATIQVDVTVFLEGPFNGTDMNTDLNPIIPLQQTLTVIGYNGPEEVEEIPNPDVVDWIGVELRDAADINSAKEETAIGGGAFFLLKDGNIVGLDGSSLPAFDFVIANQLFVVIWHRNHLPVISKYPLAQLGGIYSYDFTTSAGQAYGNNQNDLGGVFGMIAGDLNADGTINQADLAEKWIGDAGKTEYLMGDGNMDTQVDNKDKNDVWFPNLGKSEILPEGAGTWNCGSVLIDSRDGQSYNTVQIGDQCWMAENLNVGDFIYGVNNMGDNLTIEKYCYDDNPANCDTYGGLYQWNEIMNYTTSPGIQGICPENWHVPTLAEFDILVASVNDDGNALKAIGEGTGAGQGTNTSGFSALLAGNRNSVGFDGMGATTSFYSSNSVAGWGSRITLNATIGSISGGASSGSIGSSVRCLKD